MKDAIVEHGDPNPDDRRYLHASLWANDGDHFDSEGRSRILEFLDIPDHGLRRAARALEKEQGAIDVDGAKLLLANVDADGVYAPREHYSLATLLAACRFDEAAGALVRA